MSDDATPAKVRLTDGLGPLLEVRGVLANNVQIPLDVRGVYDLRGGKTGVYVTLPDDWQDPVIDELQVEVEVLSARLARMNDHAVTLAETARVVERQRIAALIAQHSGLTLETLEYLETMRQGPSPEEWAELDRAARA